MLEKDGRLVVRLREGQLAEANGQGLLDFSEQTAAVAQNETVPLPAKRAAPGAMASEQWFQLGLEQEQAGNLTEAARAYLQAIEAGGPEADTSFNLGNVLHALGRKEQAVERFREAVEADAAFVEAWNNLGVVLSELGQYEDAITALQRAVALSPAYADARYNLADTLDQSGRGNEGVPHWRVYARLDPTSPWGNYARRRLREMPHAQ
jgi:tetratricopeptide (TPR) repeat protein